MFVQYMEGYSTLEDIMGTPVVVKWALLALFRRHLGAHLGTNLGPILYPLHSQNWSLDRMVAIV